jgi:hypothetical protein
MTTVQTAPPSTEEPTSATDEGSSFLAGLVSASVHSRLAGVVPGGEVPIALLPSGFSVEVLTDALFRADERAPAPRRLKGQSSHLELGSFIDHVNRTKDFDSVIWAEPSRGTITAVYNYDGARGLEAKLPDGNAKISSAGPGWRDYRAVYHAPKSEQWQFWTKLHGQALRQDAFGNMVEDRARDLVAADKGEDEFVGPAKLLEVARNLAVRTNEKFERKINVHTGESTLISVNENEPTTSTKIPRGFLLGIPVYEAGTIYRIEASLRFAMVEGRPTFTVHLMNTRETERDAFNAMRAEVAKATGLQVFAGQPE